MVDHHFWTQKTNIEWWNCIIMLVWDEQWLQKATFQCAELATVLWCKATKMRGTLSV